MKKLLIFALMLIITLTSFSQGTNCGNADPFCTGSIYTFPAGVNAPTAQVGPNYGCLLTQPNPAWYYMQVGNSGNIEINIQGSGNFDVDFVCWGPFTSQTLPCNNTPANLTAGTPTPNHHAPGPSLNYPTMNMVDCSYDASFQEWCYIPNAITGQYYILLITNYSNQPQNIIFSQTNAGQPGAGTTNCGILPPMLSNNGPLCQGDTLKLTAATIPNAFYSWTGPGGWTSILQNPIRTNVTPSMSGNYTCLIMVGTQISPEDTTIVTIYPKPTVTSTSDTICKGQSDTINAFGASTYLWKPINSTSNPLIVSPTVTTIYTVIGTSIFGCKDSTQSIIKVNPLPIVTVQNDTICRNDTAILTAFGSLTYIWNTGAITQSIKISPLTDTSYYVMGTDINNCVGYDTASVIVYELPIIQLTSDTTICYGSYVTLNASGGSTYLWLPGSLTTSSIYISPNITTKYSLLVTNMNGCFDTSSVTISIKNLPVIILKLLNEEICANEITTILASGGNIYKWDNGEDKSQITIHPSFTTTYTVLVIDTIDGINCSISSSITQKVKNCDNIYIPNAYSPINYNGLFKPIGELKYFTDYYFSIYNRWGEQLFETKSFDNGWDGKFMGNYVKSDVYIYIFKFISNGKYYEKVGTVTVIF